MLIVLALVALSAPVDKTYTVDGQALKVTVDVLKPPITVSAKTMSTVPAAQTYIDYMRALVDGDIAKAAAMTDAPAQTTELQTAYRERLGGVEAFKAKYAEQLEGALKLTHVIKKDRAVLLVGNHAKHGAFANFLTCDDTKCVMTEPKDGDAAQLGKLFGAVREGKLKL